MNPAVVMFAKAPEPGRVKTRLAVSIGNDRAASLHGAFITDLAAMLKSTSARAYLAFAPVAEHPGFDRAWELGLEPINQGEGDLGQRMQHVADTLFAQGHDRVVIIGSDSPTLGVQNIDDAFTALADCDVYLGPSFDGGYYLIGLSGPTAAPFENMAWSTDRVAQDTVERCRSAHLRLMLGPWWYDVDEIEDLRRLRFHLLDVLCDDADQWCPETTLLLAQYAGDGLIP